MSPTSIVAYLVLFIATGSVFLFVTLFLGWLLRPKVSTPEKLETYECGEPAIGSSYVQFDLRFYVVALVFIIFDVEVAFLFPWAVVFGKANELRSQAEPAVVAAAPDTIGRTAVLSSKASEALRDFGIKNPEVPRPAAGVEENQRELVSSMRRLAQVALVDMAVFFGVLLVGFAYVWRRGDLDWVRALGRSEEEPLPVPEPVAATVSVD